MAGHSTTASSEEIAVIQNSAAILSVIIVFAGSAQNALFTAVISRKKNVLNCKSLPMYATGANSVTAALLKKYYT